LRRLRSTGEAVNSCDINRAWIPLDHHHRVLTLAADSTCQPCFGLTLTLKAHSEAGSHYSS